MRATQVSARNSQALFKDRLQPRLKRWLEVTIQKEADGDLEAYLNLLDIVRETMYFEANRPFDQHWYDVPTGFSVKKPNEYVLPVKPQEEIKELRAALEEYVTETQAYIASVLAGIGTR